MKYVTHSSGFLFACILIIIIVLAHLHGSHGAQEVGNCYSTPDNISRAPLNWNDASQYLLKNWIHVSLVACGDRLEESVVALKAIVLLSRNLVYFHIFADDDLQDGFKAAFQEWPLRTQRKFDYAIYPISFPEEKKEEWRKLFKPCASQRLFIPMLLKRVDSLLYIDTDVLFMRPVDDIWEMFCRFNSTQLAALAPEAECPSAGWYNRFARHPYYGELGLNSGVMLMNLTRMRGMPWVHLMSEYYREYKMKIPWGDQDILNVFFHYYPATLYVMDCSWNWRPDHCMYMSNCKPANENGASVIHANRRTLHNDKQPTFRELYQSLRDYPWDMPLIDLLRNMTKRLDRLNPTPCQEVRHIFTRVFQLYT